MEMNYMKYTDFELRQAFELVQNREHWKNPVNAVINECDKEIVQEAVIYFTATVPTFTQLADGKLRVQAAGYWAGPAG